LIVWAPSCIESIVWAPSCAQSTTQSTQALVRVGWGPRLLWFVVLWYDA